MYETKTEKLVMKIVKKRKKTLPLLEQINVGAFVTFHTRRTYAEAKLMSRRFITQSRVSEVSFEKI